MLVDTLVDVWSVLDIQFGAQKRCGLEAEVQKI